ncbi:ACid Phosphatase family [Caenorhabditis elegans]|uniref:ACid Phosphatase family n=1 Tax=Caenorhabditis elegans TaxID=6239 RepID=Q9GUF1_CAEEL|nr:ACid Phosphatase family [Caenorhabditis elegans]CCD74172.1 ACid Phosphatase family [Caenorhabditis elegans]|eukprot:NP_500983.1 ACid Phosphatase family [Caenorhabditis elegans]
MRRLEIFVSLIFWNIASADEHQLPLTSTQISPNTEFVIFGTRHGNRNPDEYLNGIDRSWGQEGSLELTSIGKRQGYGLGVELRKFIGNLTTTNFNASEVKYYSSSANRCQMTLQVAIAGLHPPQTYNDWNTQRFDDWSPIPYTISDPILRMYSVKSCKKSDEVWKPVDNDDLPELENLKNDNAQVLTYLSAETGWNMTENLGKAADLADNLIQMDFYNTTYPSWLTNPKINEYNGNELKKTIMKFAEIHPRSCAYYYPCRYLMGGYWLDDILSKLSDANSTKNALKVVGYASHTEVTLSVMNLMGIEKEEVTTSAGFVIEFRRQPNVAVRILNHDPNPIDAHVIYPANLTKELSDVQESDGFIRLSDFIRIVRPESYSDWPKQCDAPSCAIDNPNGNFSSSSSTLTFVSVLISTVLAALLNQ